MPELLEQAEGTMDTTSPEPDQVAPDQGKGIGDILSDALKGNQQTSKSAGTGEAIEAEQAPAVADETPFLELMIDEKTKFPFKSEEQFLKFLESNQVLKDGWLRQSDYTRKTQEIAKARTELEEKLKEEDGSWGKVKPDAQSMGALRSLWHVYANGEPQVQEAIQNFVTDVHLLANGKAPVGPLKELLSGQVNSPSQQPEVSALKTEVTRLNRMVQQMMSQSKTERDQAFKRQEAENAQKAEQEVDTWLSEKAKAKISVGRDELAVMADIMSIMDEKGQPKFTLDQAHNMALAQLGKSKAAIARELQSGSNKLKAKSPILPGSKASADLEPEPTTIKGILRQGLNELA